MSASHILFRIAIAGYIVSLVLPTVNQGQGLIFAIWGFVAFAMARVWAIVWLANPAFIASVVLFVRNKAPKTRRLLAALAVFVALFALTIDGHEGAHDGVGLQTGYWIWLGSLVAMLIAVLLPGGTEEAADAAMNENSVHETASA